MTRASGRMPVPGLRASVAIATAVFLVAVGTGAGYAAWTASVAKSASVTAARATVSAAGLADLAVAYKPGLTPVTPAVVSDTVAVTVTNSGTAPLAYGLAASGGDAALNAQIALQLWKAGTCTAAAAVPAGATSGTLASPPALPADANTAAAGAVLALCARTTYSGAFGTTAGTTPSLSVVGTVGDNWSAASAAAFTQTVGFNWFELRNKSSNKCIDVSGGGGAVGASIIIYTCKNPQAALANQSFRFALDATTGFYRIYPGSGTTTGPVWEPASTANAAVIRLAAVETGTSAKSNNQQWSVALFGAAGEFRIVNKATGFCITSSVAVDTSSITAAPCSAATSGTTFQNQRFTFTEIPS